MYYDKENFKACLLELIRKKQCEMSTGLPRWKVQCRMVEIQNLECVIDMTEEL